MVTNIARGLWLVLVGVLILSGCGAKDPIALFDEGDYDAAFPLFSERASGGDHEALNYLGLHYYLGVGTDRDFEKAVAAFRQAALGRYTDAQRNLGIMYLRGHGVSQDYHKAYGWLRQAYEQGNTRSKEYLQSLSDNVTPNASKVALEAVQEEIRSYEEGTQQ